MAKIKFLVEVGTLDVEAKAIDIIENLQNFVDEYGDEVFVDQDSRPYSDSFYYAIKVKVLETDEQELNREKREAAEISRRESHERATLLLLKEKYEKS